MAEAKLIEVNENFILKKHANGIKLINPTKNYDESCEKTCLETQSVGDILKLPLNIIFLNSCGIIENINENNAATFGCNSPKDVLGRTIHSIYKKAAADYSKKHDEEVMSTGKMIIKDEYCERMDDLSFYAITAKLPLYSESSEIVGLIGYSIPIGLECSYNIQEALISFVKLGLFQNIEAVSSFLPGKIFNEVYLSRRETECVYYLMKGNTAKMIGQILNLSPRTVEYYLSNAKTKLNARSKSELVANVLNRHYQKSTHCYKIQEI